MLFRFQAARNVELTIHSTRPPGSGLLSAINPGRRRVNSSVGRQAFALEWIHAKPIFLLRNCFGVSHSWSGPCVLAGSFTRVATWGCEQLACRSYRIRFVAKSALEVARNIPCFSHLPCRPTCGSSGPPGVDSFQTKAAGRRPLNSRC